MRALGIGISYGVALIGLTVVRGLVLQALWLWFVAETFAIASLTLVQAIGISIVVGLLTYQYDARKDDDLDTVESLVGATVAGLFICGFAYLSGAIVHSFA
jgi:hypothetical protein